MARKTKTLEEHLKDKREKYVWYNPNLDEIRAFSKLNHLYLLFIKHLEKPYIMYLGVL